MINFDSLFESMGTMVLATTVVILIAFMFKDAADSNYSYKQIQEQKVDHAFDFLMNSGNNRLSSKRYKDALREFELAYKIQPENDEVWQLILETECLIDKDQVVFKPEEKLILWPQD